MADLVRFLAGFATVTTCVGHCISSEFAFGSAERARLCSTRRGGFQLGARFGSARALLLESEREHAQPVGGSRPRGLSLLKFARRHHGVEDLHDLPATHEAILETKPRNKFRQRQLLTVCEQVFDLRPDLTRLPSISATHLSNFVVVN